MKIKTEQQKCLSTCGKFLEDSRDKQNGREQNRDRKAINF